MKKILYFVAASLLLVACDPGPSSNSTTGADSTLVDSPAVSIEPPAPPADSQVVVEPAEETPVAEVTPTPKETGTKPNNENTGRLANPKIDLNAKRFSVTGHVTMTSPYCGGAAPTPDMVKDSKTAKAYANQPFIIRSGKTNALGTALVTRVRTDAQGNFQTDLPAGTYCMSLGEKENRRTPEFLKTQFYEIDKVCDDKWLGTCDISFTVTSEPVSGLRLQLSRNCHIGDSFSPCVNWGGPLPSAPAPQGR